MLKVKSGGADLPGRIKLELRPNLILRGAYPLALQRD